MHYDFLILWRWVWLHLFWDWWLVSHFCSWVWFPGPVLLGMIALVLRLVTSHLYVWFLSLVWPWPHRQSCWSNNQTKMMSSDLNNISKFQLPYLNFKFFNLKFFQLQISLTSNYFNFKYLQRNFLQLQISLTSNCFNAIFFIFKFL